MSCFRKNQIIRSDYVVGSENFRRLFFRKVGTPVEQQQGDCRYITSDDTLVIQWAGAPGFDSGYHARYFPPTMVGLKQAHAEMDSLGT